MWSIQEPWEWFADYERMEYERELRREREMREAERSEDDYPESWELEE